MADRHTTPRLLVTFDEPLLARLQERVPAKKRAAYIRTAVEEKLDREAPPRIRAASGPTAPCSQCGRDLPVEGYCQAGPLCGECF